MLHALGKGGGDRLGLMGTGLGQGMGGMISVPLRMKKL